MGNQEGGRIVLPGMLPPRRWLAVLVLAALVAACGGGGFEPETTPDADLDIVTASVTKRAEPVIDDAGDVEDVGAATAAFAVDLYREVAGASQENVIVGPYSAWLALAMTSVGAAEGTYDELAAALHFPLDEARLLPAINALDRILTQPDSGVTFNVANRLWGQEGIELQPPFLDALVEHFGAPMVAADFATDAEAARREINGWVTERTEERIPELFPEGVLSGDTQLVLVNAVHLDAPWEFAFDPEQTTSGAFTRHRRLHGQDRGDALRPVPPDCG